MAKNILSNLQAAFVNEYVKNGGDGKNAAIAAGFSPRTAHVAACKALKRKHVRAEVCRLRGKVADRAVRSLEKYLTELNEHRTLAIESGKHEALSAANKAVEIQMKALGMLVDKSEINMKMSLADLIIGASAK